MRLPEVKPDKVIFYGQVHHRKKCSDCVHPSAGQGVVTDPSAQTAAPSTQDPSGQQPLSVENTGDHATAYSYQQSK